MATKKKGPQAPIYDAAEVASLLGIEYTADQLQSFGPPPKPVEGFVTYFDPGWPIWMLRQNLRWNDALFDYDPQFDTKEFAKRAEMPRYRQLRMDVTSSLGKDFVEQKMLLGMDEEVPLARVVIMGMVIHFLASGERLFPTYWVRCADELSSGIRVIVGRFSNHGLHVNDHWDEYPFPIIGLASLRKF